MNDFDAPWSDHRDELYARVVRRGRSLQRQRRAIAGTVAAIVLAVPLAAHATITGPSNRVKVLSTTTTVQPGRATTSTSSSSTTTTPTTPTTNPSVSTPTTLPTSASTAAASCLNSHDPACGPFRWAGTASTNPFVVLQSPTQVAAAVGQPLSVRFGMDGTGYSVTWDDGSDSQFGTFILPSECDGAGPMYGPWTLPPTPNATNIKTEAHTYAAPGTYHVSVEVFVGCLQQRLSGTTTVDVTIVVTPAATTTTGP